MSVLTLIAFLGAASLSAILLVFVYRQDELLRKDYDPEEYWFTAEQSRVAAIPLTALTHALLATLFALVSMAVWHLLTQPLGLPPLPREAAAFVRALVSTDWTSKPSDLSLAFAQTSLMHYIAIGWLGVFLLVTSLRCMGNRLYEIFISYKSEDAPLARRIADALLATGWRVWFAEYQVVLRRANFRFMFMNGVNHSWFALAITNDKWTKSEHCAMEARLMLHNFGPAKVLELRAPSEPLPHQRFPELAACASLESRDINAIVRFLEKETHNPFRGQPLPERVGPSVRYGGVHDGRPCSIDIGGWSVAGAPDNTLTSVDWIYDGIPDRALWCRLTVAPGNAHDIENNLRFGMDERLMFEIWANWLRKWRKRPGREAESAHFASDARRISDMKEARLQGKRAKPRGLHLHFHNGRPQFGLTYWLGVRDAWRRVVSLDVLNPTTKAAASFTFLFTFRGTFREYCRHAHIMDALALSLEWS